LSDCNGALWKFFTGGLLAFLFSATKSNTLPSSFCYSIEHELEKHTEKILPLCTEHNFRETQSLRRWFHVAHVEACSWSCFNPGKV
jgi:hypothetical protein